MTDGQVLSPRVVQLTTRSGVSVRRTIPQHDRRMIGAWCFVDHYGPTPQVESMSVAAHPHTGLQTASWLLAGRIDHRDSIGSAAVVEPGQLNLMTAGRGIAHSEQSLHEGHDLHGVQLWIALPDDVRQCTPDFQQYSQLPHVNGQNWSAIVFVGSFAGVTSPAVVHSPLVGAQILLDPGTSQLSVNSDFEYGVLVVAGNARVAGEHVAEGQLRYLPVGHRSIDISCDATATVLLLGGAPFAEKILMWWNFIGRTHEEIVQMQKQWNENWNIYPEFGDNLGGRIPAPDLPHTQLGAR